MRRRSGIINTVMKLPKRVYLAAAVLLFMGGAGTALALQPEKVKEPVTVQQVASVTPQQEEIVAQEPTEPVVEEEQPVVEPEPEPEPESLKDEIARKVRETALRRGMEDAEKWGQHTLDAQATCIDRVITRNYGGYDDEDKVRAYADIYLVGKTNDQGQKSQMYFMAGTCNAIFTSVIV